LSDFCFLLICGAMFIDFSRILVKRFLTNMSQKSEMTKFVKFIVSTILYKA